MKEDIGKISTTKSGLSGLLWNFSGSIIQILSQFLVVAVLARLLSPEEFGIVAIIMIMVNFTGLFAQMGIGSALIQLPKITKQHISLAYSLSVILGLFLGICFYFFGNHIGAFFDVKDNDLAFQFFALFFPFNSFNSISISLLTRELRFSLIVKCSIISYIFGAGLLSIILAFLDYGIWALILGQFAGTLIITIIMVIYLTPSFSIKFNKKIISELLFFGTGHTLGTVLNYFAENIDNIVVGKSSGIVAMGIYSKAFQLFSIPASFFGQIFDKVLFPILAKKQNEKEVLLRFYLFSNSLCFGLLFPIATILFINAELIVTILLGNQWTEVVPIFQILIFGLAYRFGTRINKSYLKSMGIIYKGAYYQFVFVIMMLIFCFVGSHFYDLKGIAYGVFFATLINYLQMSYKLYRELNFSKRIFFRIHIKTLLFCAPFFILTAILYSFDLTNIWLHFGLTLILYFPIMVIGIFSKKNVIFNPENSSLINQILTSLPLTIRNILMKIPILNKRYQKFGK